MKEYFALLAANPVLGNTLDMRDDDWDHLIHFPDGRLNASFVLSNANLLLKEGELELAATLFSRVKDHETLGHCGHYGVGQCFLAMKRPEQAVAAFEKALRLSRRTYIASALLEALMACNRFEVAEKKAIEYAQEFAGNAEFVALLKQKFERCIKAR